MKKILASLVIIALMMTSGIRANAAKGDTYVKQLQQHGEFLTFDNSTIDDREEERILVTYTISHDKLTKPKIKTHQAKYQKMVRDKKTHQLLWKRFASIVPKNERREITQFHIFTDGHDGTLAYVLPLTNRLSKWALAVDYKDSIANKNMYYSTFIHEYAHILMYKRNQWNLTLPNRCKSYVTMNRCMNQSSLANQFYENFWQGNIEKSWRSYNVPNSMKNFEKFYTRYEDRFISEYAAVHPDEDFAETFMYFFFTTEPVIDKNGYYASWPDAKRSLFFDNERLVNMRAVMLRNLMEHY